MPSDHVNAKPGTPEWQEFMQERRRQKRREREQQQAEGLVPEGEGATQEEKDELAALNLLRKQMGAKDEKISQTAAIKLLEHRRVKARDGAGGDAAEAIVYETAFAPEAYDLLVELAKEEAARPVVPAGEPVPA